MRHLRALLLLACIPLLSGSIIFPGPPVAGTGKVSISDNFDRANANPIGAPWVTVTGANPLQISSNTCKGTVSGQHSIAYYNTALSANQFAQAKVTGTDTYVLVRVSSSANTWYAACYAATNILRVKKCVNGTITTIGADYSVTITSGTSVIRIEANGTTLTPYVDGVALATRTDSATATGYAGGDVWSNGNLDNWSAGDL